VAQTIRSPDRSGLRCRYREISFDGFEAIEDQGRRVMRPKAHPENLTSLSRYGDQLLTEGLTLGIARGAPA
jgi:hypothetical protein